MRVAKKLRMGAGYNEGTDVGPLISPAAKERAERLITSAEEQARALIPMAQDSTSLPDQHCWSCSRHVLHA